MALLIYIVFQFLFIPKFRYSVSLLINPMFKLQVLCHIFRVLLCIPAKGERIHVSYRVTFLLASYGRLTNLDMQTNLVHICGWGQEYKLLRLKS